VVSACPQFIKVAVVFRALRCMRAARDVRFRSGQQLKDTFWLLRVHVCGALGDALRYTNG
jgi:hypothetical protein